MQLTIFAACAFFSAAPAIAVASAPPVPAITQDKAVDWAGAALQAHAQARPPGGARLWADVSAMGQAMAELRLQQAFATLLLDLPLGCGAGTPRHWVKTHPVWGQRLREASGLFTTTATVYDADGTVALTATLPLDGGPARLGALWAEMWAALPGAVREGIAPTASASKNLVRVAVGEATATGIVVQASGLGMAPALWPRLLAEDGEELYGPGMLPADVLTVRGVTPVHATLAAALHDPRVSERAVVVQGARLAGAQRSDVVVRAGDEAVLRAYGSLLRDGRLVFVADLHE